MLSPASHGGGYVVLLGWLGGVVARPVRVRDVFAFVVTCVRWLVARTVSHHGAIYTLEGGGMPATVDNRSANGTKKTAPTAIVRPSKSTLSHTSS